jgi:hypothetical protein
MNLSTLLKEYLSEHTAEADNLADRVLDVAIDTPPGTRRGIVYLTGAYGTDGASSKKLRNAVFNWRKLLMDMVGGSLKAGMHAESEWVIIISCLQLLNRLHQRLSVDLTPGHAVLVWCLGLEADAGRSRNVDDLLACANQKLAAVGKALLSDGDVHEHLALLEQLQTVRSPCDGEWMLVEAVRLVR